METKRTNPLIIAASIAIILTCGVGIAAMLGVLPTSLAKNGETTAQVDTAKKAEPTKTAAVQTHKSSTSQHTQVASVCKNCGRIAEVKAIKVQGDGSGLGAVAGGVAGAAVGNQMGGGNGRTAMTVIGTVGGAILGNKLEKDYKSTTQYEVVVSFDNGTRGVYKYSEKPYWQAGDRVKVVDGKITSL